METILITGASGAIGGAAMRLLRERGYRVIGTARHPKNDDLWPLDISSADSINAFVKRLVKEEMHLDGLLNNAGTMQRHFGLTTEGFEQVLATNYLGTYALTRRLLPLMNPGAHVVCTVSLTCNIAHLDRTLFDTDLRTYRQLGTYADSKMAVMLFAEELHRRYGDRLHVNVTDPGVVNSRILHLNRWYDPLTDLLFRPFCKNPEQGARPAVNALTADCDGQLFRGGRHRDIPRRWQQPELARWLWDETELRLKDLYPPFMQ